MTRSQVQYLLMGGQACVLYGAAEFSRDTDICALLDPGNLGHLGDALSALNAEVIAAPPFEAGYLARGHAVRFRCHHTEAEGMRLDVMCAMRGVAAFPELWARRTTLTDPHGEAVEVVSLPDLVQCKKTQRDKDWLMLRRLVEMDYLRHRGAPEGEQPAFWLRELRAAPLLAEACKLLPTDAREAMADRPAVEAAALGDLATAARLIGEEEQREREADRVYWAPLRQELERLRRERPR